MSTGQPPGPPPQGGQPPGPPPQGGQPYGAPQPAYGPPQPSPGYGPYNQPLYGQPPQPGYPGPGYAGPGYPPPQPQSHTLRNVLLILLAVVVLFFVGCSVLVGTVLHKAGKAIDTEVSRHAPTA